MSGRPVKKTIKKYGKNYTTLYWKPKKGNTIDKDSVKDVFNQLKKKKPNVRIDVIAEMAGQPRTITKQGELRLLEEEEYYEGKVKDVDKLVEIESLIIRYYED